MNFNAIEFYESFRAPKPKAEKNCGLIRDMIEEEQHITVRNIDWLIGLKAINSILQKHLKVVCFVVTGFPTI